jgi:hypothetical protein
MVYKTTDPVYTLKRKGNIRKHVVYKEKVGG